MLIKSFFHLTILTFNDYGHVYKQAVQPVTARYSNNNKVRVQIEQFSHDAPLASGLHKS